MLTDVLLALGLLALGAAQVVTAVRVGQLRRVLRALLVALGEPRA